MCGYCAWYIFRHNFWCYAKYVSIYWPFFSCRLCSSIFKRRQIFSLHLPKFSLMVFSIYAVDFFRHPIGSSIYTPSYIDFRINLLTADLNFIILRSSIPAGGMVSSSMLQSTSAIVHASSNAVCHSLYLAWWMHSNSVQYRSRSFSLWAAFPSSICAASPISGGLFVLLEPCLALPLLACFRKSCQQYAVCR